MNRRTIMIDNEIETKVRDIQAQLILNSNKNWSFSTVSNFLMIAGIVCSEKLAKDDWTLVKDFLDGKNVSLKKKNIKKIISNLS